MPRKQEMDNQPGAKFAKADAPTARLKYLDLKNHKIRDEVESERIGLGWIPRAQNDSDLMTHAIDNSVEFTKKCEGLGIVDAEKAAEGLSYSLI